MAGLSGQLCHIVSQGALRGDGRQSRYQWLRLSACHQRKQVADSMIVVYGCISLDAQQLEVSNASAATTTRDANNNNRFHHTNRAQEQSQLHAGYGYVGPYHCFEPLWHCTVCLGTLSTTCGVAQNSDMRRLQEVHVCDAVHLDKKGTLTSIRLTTTALSGTPSSTGC